MFNKINNEYVMIVDFSNLAYICYHAKGNMYDIFLNKLIAAQEKITGANQFFPKATHLYFAFDNFSAHKKSLYPDYKAGREKLDDDPRLELKRMLNYINCSFVEAKGYEADDVIYALVSSIQDKKIAVVSTDLDLAQCCEKKNVILFNPIKMTKHTRTDIYQKLGIKDWNKLALYKAIFGDKSDNIKPAIARLPKKTFVPFINDCDGTINSYYQILDQELVQNNIDKKWYDQFINCKGVVERNFEIVKLNNNIAYTQVDKNGNVRFLKSLLHNVGSTHSKCHKFIGVPYDHDNC